MRAVSQSPRRAASVMALTSLGTMLASTLITPTAADAISGSVIESSPLIDLDVAAAEQFAGPVHRAGRVLDGHDVRAVARAAGTMVSDAHLHAAPAGDVVQHVREVHRLGDGLEVPVEPSCVGLL